MTLSPDIVKAVLENYAKAWKTADKSLLLSLYADDVIWEDPVGTPAFHGIAGVTDYWTQAQGGEGRTLTPTVHQIVVCGNEGVIRFTMQIREPEKNQGMDMDVIDQFTLNEQGKIQSGKAYWDESCIRCPEGMELLAPDLEYED